MSNDNTKKQSITKILEPFIDMMSKADLNDHVIIIIEASEDGTPVANLMKMQASPFMALGMLDLLKNQVKEKRDYVFKRFNQASEVGKLAREADELMPNFSDRLRKALENDDVESLMNLRKEAQDMLKKINPTDSNSSEDTKDDNDGFNMDDFKGMF